MRSTPTGRTAARTLPFAHLLGFGAKAAEDPEKDPDAEDPEKDPDAEDEDDDVNAEDPDDDDRTKGRKAERKRGAAIFRSPAAALRPDMAADLAFNSDMSPKAAIRLLEAAAAGHAPRKGLGARMSAVNIKPLGAAPAPASGARSGSDALADKIIAAGKKRRGIA